MSPKARLSDVKLPAFGLPKTEPTIHAKTYLDRIERLRVKAKERGFDVFIVYGDREHYGNIAWLTGFDPRFEEALFLINITSLKKPLLLVGNEGYGYTEISPIRDQLDVILYQSFSLPSQPRGESQPLEKILRLGGVKKGSLVGVAGWKYFTQEEVEEPEKTIEIPSYISDSLRKIAGRENIINASRVLLHPTYGIRAINDVDQLARFEYVATYTSQALRDVIFKIKPGMTELEAVQLMSLNGLPLSCHLMLSTGQNASMGLPSPTSKVIERGDRFTMAYGAWGALNARAGFLVVNNDELPKEIQDYISKLVAPYFEAVSAWYASLKIGVSGGELYKVIHDHLGDPFFGVHLNPGHLISLEEWLSSPIYSGSKEKLASGMVLQVDVIPATGNNYFTTNIEDTVAIADAELRKKIREKYPEAWNRIEQRRNFMIEELGIKISTDVLPFSNIPAYLPPFILSPSKVMTLK